jgi:hypothetical protein
VSLPGKIEEAVPSVPGFDCNTKLSSPLARQFFSQGYKFCFRYLTRGPEVPGDLTEPEATDILNAGLALMPVQHAHRAPWSPNQNLGQNDGEEAVANAETIGFPVGVNVWCDVEGVSATALPSDVIEYCVAWFEAVSAAGYIPGLYVGAGELLTSQQLDALPFQHYWRSPSRVPDIPSRSYQVFQLFPSVAVNGITIDFDVTKNDTKGGAALWLRATPPLKPASRSISRKSASHR